VKQPGITFTTAELWVHCPNHDITRPYHRVRIISQILLRKCHNICTQAHSAQQEIRSPFLPEVELEQVVGDLCATLAGEDKHGVASDGKSKVAARRWNVTGLIHLHNTTHAILSTAVGLEIRCYKNIMFIHLPRNYSQRSQWHAQYNSLLCHVW